MDFNTNIKRVSYCILLCCSTVLSTLVQAQNAKEDFVRINRAYQGPAGISLDIAFSFYKSHLDDKPFQQLSGKVKQQGHNKYYQLDKIESIDHYDCQLTVNRTEKRITLIRKLIYDSLALTPSFLMNTLMLEKMLASCSRIDFNKTGKINSYLLSFSTGSYKEVKLDFFRKSFLIKKISIIYSSGGSQKKNLPNSKIEIELDNQKVAEHFTKDDFAFDEYLLNNKGKYVLTEQYKGYLFHNQYSESSKKIKQKIF